MDDNRKREAVLVAFHEACPRPMDEDVAAWAARYPEWADDIRFHADALAVDAKGHHPGEEPSDELLERTRAAAFAALTAARDRAATAPSSSLEQLAARAGTDLPALARALSLGRAPLVDLFQGRISAPIPQALVAMLADALQTTMGTVAAAVERAQPQMGRAKASSPPAARRRSFAEVVRDDPGMTPEQKASWLAQIEG